jgi:hypothetical protein
MTQSADTSEAEVLRSERASLQAALRVGCALRSMNALRLVELGGRLKRETLTHPLGGDERVGG